MQCISPVSKRAEGLATLKGPMVTFPCGKCAACLSNLRDSWKFRLQKEADSALSSWFLTLTYSDETVPLNGVDKTALQLYFKRFRKNNPKVKLRYYAIGEYGGTTLRPHYHACVFLDVMEFKPEAFENDWYNGHVHVCLCSPATIGYIANYHTVKKFSAPPDKNPAFSLMSRKPGIGASYLEHSDAIRDVDMTFTYIAGSPYVIPRYYQDKLYTPGVKRALSLRNEALRLDKYRRDCSLHPDGDIGVDRLKQLKYEAYASELKYKSKKKI